MLLPCLLGLGTYGITILPGNDRGARTRTTSCDCRWVDQPDSFAAALPIPFNVYAAAAAVPANGLAVWLVVLLCYH